LYIYRVVCVRVVDEKTETVRVAVHRWRRRHTLRVREKDGYAMSVCVVIVHLLALIYI
jgi:hypothetical protein